MARVALTFAASGPDAPASVALAAVTLAGTATAVDFGDGALSARDGGVWVYTFTDPVGATAYDYHGLITWADGSTSPISGEAATSVATALISVDFDPPDLPAGLTLTSLTLDGAAVAFGDPAFADAGGGTWQYRVEDARPGLYLWTGSAEWPDGSTSPLSGSVLVADDAGGGAAGRYTSESRLDVRLNSLNLTAYVDLEADGVRDPAAVQQAIDNAEGRVDFYTGGPFSFTGATARDQTVARATFARWSDELAVDEAVAKRVPVTSDAGLALERRVALVIKEMQAFRAGTYALPGAVADNPPDADDGDDFGEVSFVDIDTGRGTCGTGDEFAGCN